MNKEYKKLLEKQGHFFIGNHSSIKICEWTKQSIRDKGVCYKEQFYGIKSHRCCQIAPSVNVCSNNCIFCWRPVEYSEGIELKGEIDNPKQMIDNAIKAQRKLLMGFRGSHSYNKQKHEESMNPNQFAISLAGEPTLYPKISELIKEIHSRNATSF